MSTPGSRRLALPLLATGAASLIWQVASARSIMAGLYGNELVLGLVLGAWLALTGGATAAAARLARGLSDDQRRSLTSWTLLLCPVALLASAGLQQATLPGVTAVGQVVGPGLALASALACLAPCCLALGACFGLLATLAPDGASHRRWAAWIYAVESLGTVAAGLLFHLWLARVSLTSAGLAAGLAPWLAGLLLSRRRLAALAPGVLGLAALLYLAPLPGLPGRDLLQARVPGFQVLERRNSRHGALAALRREDQVLFCASGHVAFTNQDHRRLATQLHLTLLAHPRPARVLLLGGGPAGLREVLRHPVERVDYVELDSELLALASRWDAEVREELPRLLRGGRVRLLVDDGRRIMARSPGAYDVIIVTLPGPSSALNNRFYTDEALAVARLALRPGGLLRLSLEGTETYLSDELALVHATVGAALKRTFGNVAALPGGTTLLLAGKGAAPALTDAALSARYRARRIASDHFGPGEIMSRTLSFTRDAYRQRLATVRPLRNTDLRPAAHFHASLQWLSVTAPGLARRLAALSAAAVDAPWLFLLGPLLVAALATWLTRRRPLAACLAVFAAGFCGMVAELSLLLACQQLRGVVYHELAAMLTAFMAGLSAGAWIGRRLVAGTSPRARVRAVRLALGACVLGALAAMAAMLLARAVPGASLPILLGGMALIGLAVGTCFAPAAEAMTGARPGDAAARAYAWDLAGAACGALVASAFALPVLGLPVCCLLCAAVCLGCLLTY